MGGKGICSLRPLGAGTIVPSWGFQVAYNWVSAATDLLRYRPGSLNVAMGSRRGVRLHRTLPFCCSSACLLGTSLETQ